VTFSLPTAEHRDRPPEEERNLCGGNDRVLRQAAELDRESDEGKMLLWLFRHGIDPGSEQAKAAMG